MSNALRYLTDSALDALLLNPCMKTFRKSTTTYASPLHEQCMLVFCRQTSHALTSASCIRLITDARRQELVLLAISFYMEASMYEGVETTTTRTELGELI